MASPLLIVFYGVLCAIVGLLGRKSNVGFAGIFVLSLLFTPFVMALVLLVARPRSSNS